MNQQTKYAMQMLRYAKWLEKKTAKESKELDYILFGKPSGRNN